MALIPQIPNRNGLGCLFDPAVDVRFGSKVAVKRLRLMSLYPQKRTLDHLYSITSLAHADIAGAGF